MGARAATAIGQRYALHGEIASGGMATVYLGSQKGAAGFTRVVAIKRLHAHLAQEKSAVAMLLDEARLAARIRHMHVVPVIDVLEEDGEISLVMEYVHGLTLSKLVRRADAIEAMTPNIAVALVHHLLLGLHAAHETRDDRGEHLRIVHRDVSPQNVIVGVDGIARVLDFGVAKALGRLETTQDGSVKGKLAYMAPEQLRAEEVTRQSDVYAASVVLWELLARRRLFYTSDHGAIVEKVLFGVVEAPSMHRSEVSAGLDAVVRRGLARDRCDRFPTALAMATALCEVCPPATTREIATWIEGADTEGALAALAKRVAEIETTQPLLPPTRPTPPSARSLPVRRVLVLTLGIGALSAAGAIAAAMQHREPAPVSDAPRSAAPVAEAPAPPVAESEPAPPPSPASPEPAASAPTPTPSPPAVRSRSTGPSVRAAAAPARRPDCDPPFSRDAEGRKIWKRECLNAR